MAARSGKLPTLLFLVCLSALLAPTAQSNPLDNALVPVLETVTSAMCIDAWRATRPCRTPVWRLREGAHPADVASRWWSDLWSAAGEAASSPHFLFAGKRTSCGSIPGSASLLKLDFLRFQLNMDFDLDEEEDRFDTVRLAYHSCWR